jgi:hypothetical protein
MHENEAKVLEAPLGAARAAKARPGFGPTGNGSFGFGSAHGALAFSIGSSGKMLADDRLAAATGTRQRRSGDIPKLEQVFPYNILLN